MEVDEAEAEVQDLLGEGGLGALLAESGIDAALAAMGISLDEKTTYKKWEAENMPRLKEENPGLKKSQYHELAWKEWKKSPERTGYQGNKPGAVKKGGYPG